MTLDRKLILVIIMLVVIVGGISAIVWKYSQPQALCSNLSCVEIRSGAQFTLKETYSDSPTVYRALFSTNDKLIRIEAQKTNPQNASRELDAGVTRMKALFEKAPAPYPGDVSDSIVCDPNFAPQYHTKSSSEGVIQYFIGYLNDRLTFGSCSKDQAVYKGIMAFVYCKPQSLAIRIELIAPIKTFISEESTLTDQLLALRCAR